MVQRKFLQGRNREADIENGCADLGLGRWDELETCDVENGCVDLGLGEVGMNWILVMYIYTLTVDQLLSRV